MRELNAGKAEDSLKLQLSHQNNSIKLLIMNGLKKILKNGHFAGYFKSFLVLILKSLTKLKK